MQTALYARELLLTMSENKQYINQQLFMDQEDNQEGIQSQDTMQEGISAALSAKFSSALDDETNEVPFLDPNSDTQNLSSTIFNGIDLSKPVVYDAFLDEIILLLQRCTSYWRMIIGKSLSMNILSSSTIPSISSLEYSLKEHHQLFDAVKEIGNKYSALENSYIQSGINKAIILEEMIDDGIQGASIDLTDIHIPVSTTSNPNPIINDTINDLHKQYNTTTTGKGALLSTFVEDTFYVLQKAAKRALASGNAEVTAAVLNSIVATIQERIGNELELRFRLALATEPNEITKVSNTMTSIQIDCYNTIRNNVMVSSAVRNAPHYITEYATIGCTNNQGLIKTDNNLSSNEVFSSPNKGSNTMVFRSPNDPSGSALAISTPPTGTSTSSSSSSSFGGRQGLKFTEEIAIICLICNNLQLAAECTIRLQKLIENEIYQIFQDTKELQKVRNSLNGLQDCVIQLRKLLETSLSTVVTRLTPRLRSALNMFEGASSLIQYELNENTFNINSTSNTTLNAFITEFLPTLGTILGPYQYGLTPSLAYHLINKIIIYINKQLEPRLRRKRFNQFGGLQLDNDIRLLINFFYLRIPYQYIRNKFLRLLQFSQLINMEIPQEIYEYWGNNNNQNIIPWEYSAEEVKTILLLRSDFVPSEIHQLQL